jgi:hypothetical protein
MPFVFTVRTLTLLHVMVDGAEILATSCQAARDYHHVVVHDLELEHR